MDGIVEGAIGGAIAGVVAAAILGALGWLHRWQLRRQEVAYIRDVVTQGRKRVLEAKEFTVRRTGKKLPADKVRADDFNLMVKELGVALEHTTPNLVATQKKDMYGAVDFFHTKHSYVIDTPFGAEFASDIPPGRWPNTTMEETDAVAIFERLESIKWLKLKPYVADSST